MQEISEKRIQERKEKLTARQYLEIFISFFKIGAFTIGGGYAMLPIIQKEVVEKKMWIDEDAFLDMLALSQSSPGPIAVNISIFCGLHIGRLAVIFTLLGTFLPSFIIILLVAIVFTGIEHHEITIRVFNGIRPAVVALILAPLIKMSKAAGVNVRNFWIPLSAALLVSFANISPIYIILLALIVAVLIHYRQNQSLKNNQK